MTRKARSDSITAVIGSFANAAKGDLQPPDYITLRDCDKPFFTAVVRARARDEWTETDLVVACQLARCMADIERETALLEAEGSVMANPKGTMVANPRATVLEQLARREMAQMRTLQIGGVAAGPRRELQNGRKLEAGARQAKKEVEAEDSLLA